MPFALINATASGVRRKGTPELPVMFRTPWSSALAGGRTSSFSSPVGISPVRTASTLWLPNNGFQPTPKTGAAEAHVLADTLRASARTRHGT